MTSPLLGLKNTKKVAGSRLPLPLQTQGLAEDKGGKGRKKRRDSWRRRKRARRGMEGERRQAAASVAEAEGVKELLPSCASSLCRGSIFLQANLDHSHSHTASEFLVWLDVQEQNPQSYWRAGPLCLVSPWTQASKEADALSWEKCKCSPSPTRFAPNKPLNFLAVYPKGVLDLCPSPPHSY